MCSGECGVQNCGLSHPRPEIFVTSQWPMGQLLYFIYRIIAAVFFIVWIVLSGVIEYPWYIGENNRIKWFIYLTNWMFWILTVDTIVQMVVVASSLRKIRSGRSYSSMPWHFKAMWVVYNMSCPINIVVSLAFWILLYPALGSCSSNEVLQSCGSPATPTCSEPNPIAATVCVERCGCPNELPIWYDGSCIELANCPNPNSTEYSTATYRYPLDQIYHLHYVDVVTHAGNSVYVLLNLFITAIPFRIQHFWHSIVFAVTFILFSVIYDVLGGTSARNQPFIYSPIDWTAKPGWSTVYAAVVGFVAPVLVWFLLYGCYRLRIALAKCCGLEDSVDILSNREKDYGRDGKDIMLSNK